MACKQEDRVIGEDDFGEVGLADEMVGFQLGGCGGGEEEVWLAEKGFEGRGAVIEAGAEFGFERLGGTEGWIAMRRAVSDMEELLEVEIWRGLPVYLCDEIAPGFKGVKGEDESFHLAPGAGLVVEEGGFGGGLFRGDDVFRSKVCLAEVDTGNFL